MPDFPHLLIAGCGDLGCRTGVALARQGWFVQGLRRQVAALPAAIAPLRADLSQAGCPPGWPAQAPDYLLYAAAADRSDEPAYRAAYVEGLRHVLDCEPQGFTGRVLLEA